MSQQIKPTQKKQYKILLFVNLIVVFVLLLTYLSVYINPNDFKYIAIIGLAYPVVIFVNIIFGLIWLFLDYKKAFISFICLLLGWHQFSDTFQINTSNIKDTSNSFKVLTYNVRMFDKYNWIKEKGTASQIIEFINDENPDILCLQEFFSNDTDSLDVRQKLKNIFKSNYKHIVFASEGSKIYNYGIATYSTYPIVNKGSIKYEDSKEISIFSDIVINEDTIRFYNCHLESVHFAYEDYHFIDSLSVADSKTNKMQKFRKIVSKLLNAYVIRAVQSQIISEHIKKSPYPVIVAGDFNDTPISYVYNKVSKNLEDAFVNSGSGTGSTYSYNFFNMRIDYILYDNLLESYDFKTHKINLSDHFPVSCRFVTKKIKD